jgi:hypothetical protein
MSTYTTGAIEGQAAILRVNHPACTSPDETRLIQDGICFSGPIPIMQYFNRKSFISRWIAFTDRPACLFLIEFNTIFG